MSNIADTAKEYLSYGLSILPLIGENDKGKDFKAPAVNRWTHFQSKPITTEEVDTLFKLQAIRPEIKTEEKRKDGSTFISKGIKAFITPRAIGIMGGAVSGNLEIIDVDTKHDTTGSLWDELRTLIESHLPETYKELVIAQTKSGGYHIYYRCSKIEGNLKLSVKQNREVLVETRGEAGYVVAPPTPGWSYIQGDPGKIPTIPPEDRDLLINICRSFNEQEEEEPKQTATSSTAPSYPGLSPFEDYNNRGDVVALLVSKGWRATRESGDRIYLKRPGETDTKYSGNFHTGLKTLRVFSTSTEFSPDKAYSPAQVFSLLEGNLDNKETYKRLLALGYGEPYSGDKKAPVKTALIKVEAVNGVNTVNKVISTPGDTLTIETIETEKGDIVITSPGAEAQEEVLKALDLIEETGKRIYIKEGSSPEIRSYQFRLDTILQKYIAIQTERDLLPMDVDSLLDEVVETASRLKDPIDRDLFKKLFISTDGVKELGITEESLSITVDRLTSTRDKETQAKEFNKLLGEAKKLQDKGDTDSALSLLDKQSKQIKAIVGKDLLPPPLSLAILLDEIATIPPAYKTGYKELDKFVGFTPGAISLIAGRPGHGKTTFMFNLLLQMSQQYQDKNFYFFTYEEPVKNLSIKLLNRLTATDLSGYYSDYKDLAKPTNYEFIKAYIRAKRTDIKEIEEGKRLLSELIDSQRIKLIDVNYSVEELSTLIAYINKKEQIGGVLIDYIQRMRTERKTQDKRTEIAHISDQVLQIAKETGLPIILGAQLNRATVSSGDKKPSLENLKEAGNLEEDANTVISVYNENREKEETEEGLGYSDLREVDLEIKALKNREGEVNKKTNLTFDKWTGVIKD